MLKRTITGIVALLVFFAVVFAGDLAFRVAVDIVILLMLYETYGAMTKSNAVKVCGFIGGAALLAGIRFNMLSPALIAVITLTMLFLIALHGRVNCRELFAAMFMTLYITLFTSCIALMRHNLGLRYAAFIFIIAWGSDTAAYFTGSFLGKHKLAPHLSPKKTIEGSAGAVIAAALMCMLYVFIMGRIGKPIGAGGMIYAKAALLGLVCSALSQAGDLAASAIKRDMGIKDYGKIFPGHGGFMDRFDSVIFIAPIVYLLITVL